MWHEELYKIYKKGRTFNSVNAQGFRLFTKRQLVYVVAGGTSIHVSIHENHYRIITKEKGDYLQVSKIWYLKRKDSLDQCLTYQDEIKQFQKENRTTLDSFKLNIRGEKTK